MQRKKRLRHRKRKKNIVIQIDKQREMERSQTRTQEHTHAHLRRQIHTCIAKQFPSTITNGTSRWSHQPQRELETDHEKYGSAKHCGRSSQQNESRIKKIVPISTGPGAKSERGSAHQHNTHDQELPPIKRCPAPVRPPINYCPANVLSINNQTTSCACTAANQTLPCACTAANHTIIDS